MLHRDSVGHEEKITATRLMLMNAGRAFQHEEKMLDPDPVHALQIFMRPRAPGLQPKVQFHDFGEVLSRDAWRLVAAPEGAPLEVRAQAWVEDARLSAGKTLSLPALPVHGAVRLLYVVAAPFVSADWRSLTVRAPTFRKVEESRRRRRTPISFCSRRIRLHRSTRVACSAEMRWPGDLTGPCDTSRRTAKPAPRSDPDMPFAPRELPAVAASARCALLLRIRTSGAAVVGARHDGASGRVVPEVSAGDPVVRAVPRRRRVSRPDRSRPSGLTPG